MKNHENYIANTNGASITFNVERADPSGYVLMCIHNSEGDNALTYKVELGIGGGVVGAYVDPEREATYSGLYNAGQVFRIPAAPQIIVTLITASVDSGCTHAVNVYE